MHPLMLLIIILELKMDLQNICRRVDASVLFNIPPSNIFPNLLNYFIQIVRLVLAALSTNGLTLLKLKCKDL